MKKIRIGQIGVGHNHGAERMKALRELTDRFEVVGVAEDDPEWRKKRGDSPAYRGLPMMHEAELLATPGLEAVMIETDGPMLLDTALRCARRGLHLAMDKPGGEDLAGQQPRRVRRMARPKLVEEFTRPRRVAETHLGARQRERTRDPLLGVVIRRGGLTHQLVEPRRVAVIAGRERLLGHRRFRLRNAVREEHAAAQQRGDDGYAFEAQFASAGCAGAAAGSEAPASFALMRSTSFRCSSSLAAITALVWSRP